METPLFVGVTAPIFRNRMAVKCAADSTRRAVLLMFAAPLAELRVGAAAAADSGVVRGKIAGKPETVYPDFTRTESGLQYRDRRDGKGTMPVPGDRVVIDWEGYTLGHQGRMFAAKNRLKGGDFQGEQDLFRWVVGEGRAIPALDEAVQGMRQGGVRQIVVPLELGYPPDDPKHDRVGPKPPTFAGQQRLDFVLLSKGLVDATLLINIELVRVDRPGERGFRR